MEFLCVSIQKFKKYNQDCCLCGDWLSKMINIVEKVQPNECFFFHSELVYLSM